MVRSGALAFVCFAGLAVAGSWPIGSVTAATNFIQPGDQMSSPQGGCTLNFVYRGPGGQTLIGTAGHCVEPNDLVTSPGFVNFGTVVYDEDGDTDFALIQVKTQFLASVSPEVKGHPGFPVGFTRTTDTSFADVVRLSGYGMLFSLTQATQEERLGALWSDTGTHYCADAPAIFGDSGGPVLHEESKKALGLVNALGATCSLTGTTIEGAMAKAADRGFPVTLLTV